MGNRTEWRQDEPNKHTAYMREWIETEKGQEHRENHKEYMKEWREKNKEKYKATQKRCYDKARLEVLTHYSGGVKPFCKCCGEDEILFLQIDHINGDGADHRRKLKEEIGYYPGGNGLPYWLKKNGYPEGFQILCANCNLGKRTGLDCPHKTAVEAVLYEN